LAAGIVEHLIDIKAVSLDPDIAKSPSTVLAVIESVAKGLVDIEQKI